ncbi:MAG: type IIL restriction-modification enzyme MmeI [Phototrophicaceae bacterium]
MAWSDREWTLNGAAVRVSMVGFDDGREKVVSLNGNIVSIINVDLTASVDITIAKTLNGNDKICFGGTKKGGAFDIPAQLALQFIQSQNNSGLSNRDVIKPWANGTALIGRPTKKTWIIDFGTNRDEQNAMRYEAPYKYVKDHVYDIRKDNNMQNRATYWWLHSVTASDMRESIKGLQRFIATPRVSKFRLFVWVAEGTIIDDGAYLFARDDDYFFGVLHSRLHEVWSLRMGTSLGETPRYTPTTTFETFPFPYAPGAEPTAAPEYQEIAAAAAALHAERDAWLNPPALVGNHPPHTPLPDKIEAQLKDRTLTNLYNALAVFRGTASGAVKRDAGDFAPRLDELHRKLDVAVCAAYGWDIAILDDEEAMLAALLALNLARAAGQGL